jgi:hypothetical protein
MTNTTDVAALADVLRELDDRTNQTWAGKRSKWAEFVRTQAARIAKLESALKKANSQAEHFEREWYLRGDELESAFEARQVPEPLGKAIPAPPAQSTAHAVNFACESADRWSNSAINESGMPMLVGFAPSFIPPAGMNDEYTGRDMGRKADLD